MARACEYAEGKPSDAHRTAAPGKHRHGHGSDREDIMIIWISAGLIVVILVIREIVRSRW
jgi:hypothetical protein